MIIYLLFILCNDNILLFKNNKPLDFSHKKRALKKSKPLKKIIQLFFKNRRLYRHLS